jgi:hypothetical protein
MSQSGPLENLPIAGQCGGFLGDTGRFRGPLAARV